MRIRRLLPILITIGAIMILATPALAGGWAVFTLEELPSDIVAGTPVTIRYTIRQHGIRPITVEDSNVNARHPESGESLAIQAKPGKATGEFSATITFPVAGSWEWYLDGFGKQAMPDLTVLSSPVASKIEAVPSLPAVAESPKILSWLGLLVAAGALMYAAILRKRWALGLVITGLLVAAAGFGAGNMRTSAQSQNQAAAPMKTDAVAYGKALFVAKGCGTCHDNRNIERRYQGNSVNIAVDLTSYPTSLEYLRIWLKDPTSIKPKTEMPNLGLKEVEIEALAAFLLASVDDK